MGQNIIDKSTESSIPYNELDYQIIPLVDLLNRIGYKTQFSCWGHNERETINIIFDESVTDKKIDNLMRYIHTNKPHCNLWFKKWKRICSEKICENWIMEFNGTYGYEDENDMNKYRHYYDILSFLCKFTVDAEL